MPSLFKIPIQQLYKVGPKKAEQFQKLGIDTVGALLRFYPRSYEDWSCTVPLREAEPTDNCCIKATVEKRSKPVRVKGGITLFKLTASDGDDVMTVTLFNRAFLYDQLHEGHTYLFYGTVRQTSFGYEMTSPQIENTEKEIIRPIYPQTGTLTSKQIENSVAAALKLLPETINDPIPAAIREEYDICPLDFALHHIHFPTDKQTLTQARKRVVFEELLILQLGIGLRSSDRLLTHAYPIQTDYTEEFLTLLPYTPTNAQRRVMEQCLTDMKQDGCPMHRLIQGDVGSGKTAVAAALCYTAAKNGLQCAFMVPTEILAEQHYQSLTALFADTGLHIELLTGSTRTAEKRRILTALECGLTDIVIGTHALISDTVSFRQLGLVITDEQHRFGVSQRSALSAKGNYPHIAVMSATPIPRTLALMIFGDLDLSVIDEMPPGRLKTDTYLVSGEKRPRIYTFLKKQIDTGRQCYIVCPLVEQNDSELLSAEAYRERLEQTVLKDYRIALLHGRMKAAEKDRIMGDFAAGAIDILVATTVIEVGVNVPNAAVMLIENADRFGLSQLHQLRGRVGRGQDKSYCIMVTDTDNPATLERLRVMCRTNNGFEIADEDLRLRGPGDFFGTRQHGLPVLKSAKLSDMVSLEAAREAAQRILSDDPTLSQKEHRPLLFELRRLFYSSESGKGLFGSA